MPSNPPGGRSVRKRKTIDSSLTGHALVHETDKYINVHQIYSTKRQAEGMIGSEGYRVVRVRITPVKRREGKGERK